MGSGEQTKTEGVFTDSLRRGLRPAPHLSRQSGLRSFDSQSTANVTRTTAVISLSTAVTSLIP
jgi:hypothetical protein